MNKTTLRTNFINFIPYDSISLFSHSNTIQGLKKRSFTCFQSSR
ncbi:hypothetical protein HPHPP23_0178 [Helicobacter pylori Hp P-23]|nr:hypothetical protein HPHPP23_0178 [Helicobacter pylori Hp P-23]EJC17493.1 hypothetical protein HPHPP74_0256 [Helicobacter pylori Hp P-74]